MKTMVEKKVSSILHKEKNWMNKGFNLSLVPLRDIVLDGKNYMSIISNYKYWFNDPDVTRFNSHGLFPFNPIDGVENYLKDNSRIVWAIVISNLGEIEKHIISHNVWQIHIGNVAIQSINLINRSAEITCVIGEKDYWGMGIMTWACKKIIEHGFNCLGLNRIWSGTARLNIGMQKVFDKLGFTREGVFGEGMFLKGEFVDVLCYGLIRSNWLTNNKNNDNISLNNINDTPSLEVTDFINYEEEKDNVILNEVENMRTKNNANWMDLVRLAVKYNKKEAVDIIEKIVKKDKKVTGLMQELIDND